MPRRTKESDVAVPTWGPCEAEPVTVFQQRVYEAVRCVPRGRVTTYRDMARCLHCGSARAVGQALRRNPFSPGIPCHRVIAADLSIGGFQGHRNGAAVRRKLLLLKGEGVLFANGRLADPSRLVDAARISVKRLTLRQRDRN